LIYDLFSRSEFEPHWPFPPDSADYKAHIAQKIIEGIESGEAEIFAHDWLKQRARGNQQETTQAA
jgi:hypothetical protein